MSILSEFGEFAMKGNVVSLAIGVIMGAAFGPIVSTLVDNVIMPPIGLMLGGVDFSNYMAVLHTDPDPTKVVAIRHGLFLNALIKFMITAAAIFMLVKAMNQAKKRFDKPAVPATPPAPSPSEVYLKEIRGALVSGKR